MSEVLEFKELDEVRVFLEKRSGNTSVDETIRHEGQHAQKARELGFVIRGYNLYYRGSDNYICEILFSGETTDLGDLVRIALAPEVPSRVDWENAKRYLTLMAGVDMVGAKRLLAEIDLKFERKENEA